MFTKTRVALGALAGVAVLAGGASAAAAQTSAPAPGHLTFDVQGTAMKFFSNTGPMGPPTPTTPLVPGDRVIAAGRWFQDGKPVGHDDEVCTEAFGRDALCQDMLMLWGQGDLHSSYDFRWPASGRGPAGFDGVIDGGTGRFRAAHGWFHYQILPNGHEQIAVTISGDG
jgi:hypothetical protein